MSRDPRLYIEDMQSACRKILHYTNGMSQQNFLQDDKTYGMCFRGFPPRKHIPPTFEMIQIKTIFIPVVDEKKRRGWMN